jgi:hypothetical protein
MRVNFTGYYISAYRYAMDQRHYQPHVYLNIPFL